MDKSFLLATVLGIFLASCAKAFNEEHFSVLRKQMVQEQLTSRGVKDSRVIAAMQKVPRHLFVPENLRDYAYEDHPLSIGYSQTISQPYIVAYMTEAANLSPENRVLEIGTGSGYQAAILAELVKEVYSIEIIQPLAEESQARLKKMGYRNITVKIGDGYEGWIQQAPFDAIIVTAAPETIPQKLIDQLTVGGRMIIPVGSVFQNLYRLTKTPSGIFKESLLPVRFVPMIKGD